MLWLQPQLLGTTFQTFLKIFLAQSEKFSSPRVSEPLHFGPPCCGKWQLRFFSISESSCKEVVESSVASISSKRCNTKASEYHPSKQGKGASREAVGKASPRSHPPRGAKRHRGGLAQGKGLPGPQERRGHGRIRCLEPKWLRTLPVLPYSHTQKLLIFSVILLPVLLQMLSSRCNISSMIISTGITHLQHVREARWLFHSVALAAYEVQLTSHIYYHIGDIPLNQLSLLIDFRGTAWPCVRVASGCRDITMYYTQN